MTRGIGSAVRIGYVTAFVATDRDVVIGDMQYSPHLAVLDRVSGQLTARLGPDGTQPGHLREPSCVMPVRDDANAVWVYDRARSVLARLRLYGVQAPLPTERHLGNLGPATLCATWMASGLVAHNYTPEYLHAVDSTGNADKAFHVPPPFAAHDELNHSVFAASPDGRHMALAYEYANRLDLLDGAGVYVGFARGPRPINELKYSLAMRGDVGHEQALVSRGSETAYLALAASNDRVYALFSGCAGACAYAGTQIQVFRWNGELITEFAVDRTLVRIAVGPNDDVLYGVAIDLGSSGHPETLGEWILPRRK